MSAGLPVVVTSVGGLVEAAADYEGAEFVPPRDPRALGDALRNLLRRRDERYADPHSWATSVSRFDQVFQGLGVNGTMAGTPAGDPLSANSAN